MNERIFLSPPHMTGKELEYVQEAFDTNFIAPLGPMVDGLEADICKKVDIPHAAALSSGTAALHLGLQLAGVSHGDYVLCSNFTFIASAGPITYLGAEPIFIDSDLESWTMSPDLLEEAIHSAPKRPKAIVVTHIYGQCADMGSIMDIANKYAIPVIEDAAEALGAKFNGQQAGTFGQSSIFSFNGNKIITSGGGGMLVSKDKLLIEKARSLSTQAREKSIHYEHKSIGYNYRLSNVLAAIGRAQLEGLDNKIKRKKEIFSYYKAHLSPETFVPMPVPKKCYTTHWLSCFTLRAESKIDYRDIINALNKENIESRPLWMPMHMQPVFQGVQSKLNGVSEKLFNSGLCLPCGTNLKTEQLDKIINILNTTAKR